MILFNDFTVSMRLAILFDLMTKLLMMNLNKCLSTLKAFDSFIYIDNCVKYATIISMVIPRSRLLLFVAQKQNIRMNFIK